MIIPQEAGTLAEILGRNGYRTCCVGQWHHNPRPEAPAEPRTAATSRRTWPLGRGFDRYYGCLERQTSPWYPDLVYDNQHVDPPYPPADRYRGRFDMGYDRYREVVLGNMKRLGIVPGSTALAAADGDPASEDAARGHVVRPWRSLTEEQRQLSSRLAESAAGLCSYTDQQVGRLMQYPGESGQLDDAIVVACSANATSPDDGPTAAGGPGTPGEPLSDSDVLAGWPGTGPVASASCGDDARSDYSAGWAWAFKTPYNAVQHGQAGLAGRQRR